MARSKKDEIISFDKEDFEGGKHAPAGKHHIKLLAKSAIEPNKAGTGNNLVLMIQISRGKYKGVSLRDYLSANGKWKIAQLMGALGIKKMKISLQELLKLLKGKELRAVLKTEEYEGRTGNKVVAYLPLEAAESEEVDEDDEDEDEDEEENDVEESDDEDEDEEEDDDDSDEDDDDEDEEDEEEEEDDDEEEEDEDEDEDEEEDEDDDEEDEDEEEEDDEDDEPVTRRAPAKKAAAKKVAKKAAPKGKKAKGKK